MQSTDAVNLANGEEYEVISELGEGGFGSVYLIKLRYSEEKYALKILDLWRMKPSDHLDFVQRFKEGYKAGLIKSDYLVNNYNFGYIDSNPYLVMDYCSNGNLSRHKNKFYNYVASENLISNVLNGLRDLHRNGFIHRDLKPENILFDNQMVPKLCDFDIAGRYGLQINRMTKPNFLGNVRDVWGTLVYASPEQLDHSKAFKYLGPQMDIYSLAVTMYELLSGGNLPFGSKEDYQLSPREINKRILQKKFTPISKWRPDIDNKWNYYFEACLDPIQANRPANIDEISALLKLERLNTYNYQKSLPTESLIIKSGEEIGKTYNLKELRQASRKNVLRLGWLDPENNCNDICIREPETAFISKRHATIEFSNGSYFIRDGQWVNENSQSFWKYSMNGLFLNSEKINKNQALQLQCGDVITVGNINLQFY
ncbi:MAG: protein kinase [Saprospiraceae bacterium]|nr:protein kinase [Saprospiraceae bacterium]